MDTWYMHVITVMIFKDLQFKIQLWQYMSVSGDDGFPNMLSAIILEQIATSMVRGPTVFERYFCWLHEVDTVHGCVEKIASPGQKWRFFLLGNGTISFPCCWFASPGFSPGASWLLTSCNGCGTQKTTVWVKLDGYLMVWESVFMRYSFLFYRRLAGTESHLHGNLFCRIEDLIKQWMSILLVFVLGIFHFREGVPNCFWKNSKEVNSRWGGKKRCKTRQSAIQGSESKIKTHLPPATLQHLCSVQICVGTHKHWGVKTRSLTTPFDFGSWPASWGYNVHFANLAHV